MRIEPITWKTWTPTEPKDFPCMVCRNAIATHKITNFVIYPNIFPVSLTLVTCEECLLKCEEFIRENLGKRR